MKKILIPTDFSEASNNALEVAIQIAKKSDQDLLLVLMNVVDLDRFFTTNEAGEYVDARQDPKYKAHLISNAEQKLEDLIEKYKLTNATGKVETGDVIEIINKSVEEEEIDLVIVGAHSSNIYQEMLFSSTTDRVIRTVTCPVLTIRKSHNFKADNLVFATNLDEEHGQVISQIKEMQRLFGSTIHLVYINTPADFYNNRRLQSMKDTFVEKYQLENYTFSIYDDFTIETGIAHFCEDAQADVLALAATHLNDLMDYTFSSHTSDIVIDVSSRPVLTFAK
jgi:nucleotide-binding universal stress UspA family protein